jgi:hypothetical protein
MLFSGWSTSLSWAKGGQDVHEALGALLTNALADNWHHSERGQRRQGHGMPDASPAVLDSWPMGTPSRTRVPVSAHHVLPKTRQQVQPEFHPQNLVNKSQVAPGTLFP